ncbi:hypothetical protein D3C72_975340 [compost metagenome]
MVVLADAAVAALHVDPAHEADTGVDVLQHPQHLQVAGHRHQPFMEGLVEFHEFFHRAVARFRAGVLEEGEQGVDVLFPGPHDGQAQRLGLHDLAQLVEGKHFLGIQIAAEEALARREAQQPFGRQAGQRLAQRGAADAQRTGQHAFVEPFAGFEVIAHAHLLELVINLLDDAVTCHGCHGIESCLRSSAFRRYWRKAGIYLNSILCTAVYTPRGNRRPAVRIGPLRFALR